MTILSYLVIGVVTGLVSGAFGIGGGLLMVPVFLIFFGLSQHQAQGTSLAVMALGVFLLPAWRYYVAGNVNIKMAIYVAIGVIIGSFVSAHYIQGASDGNLKKAFGIFMIIIGLKMLLLK